MLFSGVLFLFCFFPAVFAGYYLLSFSRSAQNIWLLLASLFFYCWGDPVFLPLLLISIFVNWGAGLLISSSRSANKTIFILSCLFNAGLLILLKYFVFLSEVLLGSSDIGLLSRLSFSAPLGISFFTLRAISYCADIFLGKSSAEKNPLSVGLYISFFPQLIAGPAEKYRFFAKQLYDRKSSARKISVGACRFVTGLGKKVLLADNMAALADLIFSRSEMGSVNYNLPVVMAWLGIIAFAMQIYFDFSGYCDMAVGLALIFGFKSEESFNYPYAASSVSDFWNRWNITLTDWFREYIYIPLCGKSENKDRATRSLFIVCLLIGIWHGAEWTFIFWALWNFVFILAERFLGYAENNPRKGLMHLYTLLSVLLGWVIFRSKDLYQAGCYYSNLLGLNKNSFFNRETLFLLQEYGFWLILSLILVFPVAQRCNTLLVNNKMGVLGKLFTLFYPLAMTALFLLSVVYILQGGARPFILL